MSTLKLSGLSSGSSILKAPNSGSTGVTFTLPASAGTLVTTADVTNKLPLAGGTMTGALNIGSVGNLTNSGPDLKITGTDDIFFNVAGASNNILQLYGGSSANDQSKFDSHVHPLTDNSKDLGNSSERWKDLYLSGGLKVGGTDAAHTLDDYEEGTWTPTLTGTSGGPSGVNFTYRLGWYTKIGRVVTANCRVEMSSWSSAPSGVAQISGLPFSAPASSGYFSAPSIGFARNFDSDNAPKGGFIEEGNSVIRLIKANGTSARENFSQNVSASALNGNESIFITITYIVSA